MYVVSKCTFTSYVIQWCFSSISAIVPPISQSFGGGVGEKVPTDIMT